MKNRQGGKRLLNYLLATADIRPQCAYLWLMYIVTAAAAIPEHKAASVILLPRGQQQ